MPLAAENRELCRLADVGMKPAGRGAVLAAVVIATIETRRRQAAANVGCIQCYPLWTIAERHTFTPMLETLPRYGIRNWQKLISPFAKALGAV